MRAPTKSLDGALDDIAALAKIPQNLRPHFCDRVRDMVDAAIPGIKKMRLNDEGVTPQLRAAKYKARGLLVSPRKIDVPQAAGLRLRAATMHQRPGVTIKHFIGELKLLIEAAEAAASDIARFKRSAGRPGGTPGNLGFDLFVQQLDMNTRAAGGKLTIFKLVNGDYGGSLLKTIELLRAHLPRGFVQGAGLGRRLHRIVHGR